MLNKTISILLIILAVNAFAQTDERPAQDATPRTKRFLYTWTDEKGGVHITDGLGNVPPKYRDKAVRTQQQDQEEIGEASQPLNRTTPPPAVDTRDAEEDQKAEWQYRMNQAKNRLTEAEQRYRELEARRSDLLGRSLTSPTPGTLRIEAIEVEAEMKKVEKEIQEAKHEINVAIPEEARKAGIPPGWIRD